MSWRTEPATSAGELDPSRLIPAALAAGALHPADLAIDGVLVEQVGRSHPVYRVSIGGRARFYLKTFGPRRGATDGMAAREHAVQALARERQAVAALMPPPWPWEGEGAGVVVATAAVDGAEAWTQDVPGGGTQSVEAAWATLVDAFAPRLAAFHRATRDLARPGADVPDALRAHEPWALCLMDGDAAPELWATPMLAAVLAEAAADPALVAGLRAARALWTPMALIHADLKHDNLLVAQIGDTLDVCVVDWEMARVGDPAWDLAGLVARLATARTDGPPWPGADIDAVALLLARYAEASGLPVPALARRTMSYVGAVLLMMALQHTATLAPGADIGEAKTLVMKSRSTFRRADALAASVVSRAMAGAA
jgi:aminoglycoside phosphotransferase (APT) family kinase protein